MPSGTCNTSGHLRPCKKSESLMRFLNVASNWGRTVRGLAERSVFGIDCCCSSSVVESWSGARGWRKLDAVVIDLLPVLVQLRNYTHHAVWHCITLALYSSMVLYCTRVWEQHVEFKLCACTASGASTQYSTKYNVTLTGRQFTQRELVKSWNSQHSRYASIHDFQK